MGSLFGSQFRVTTFGESHGVALGCVVDGCPSLIPLSQNSIQQALDRRKPGQNEFTTSRSESDQCEILSGVEDGVTLGSPICIIIRNQDQRPNDYHDLSHVFRPGHADYTTWKKYGLSSKSGGGRASARETVGRVAAGAVARAYVETCLPGVQICAWVSRVGQIQAHIKEDLVTIEDVEKSPIRCPDACAEEQMKDLIKQTKKAGDSVGGSIRCIVKNVPAGLGEPVFDKFEACLAQAMLSIPACKFFESGDGFASSFQLGSQNNDLFYVQQDGSIGTKTNFCGGIQGGITNGMPISFTVGFKPVSTLFQEQVTVTKDNSSVTFKPTSGRHDPCVLPRAVPIVEAMAWLVLADQLSQWKSRLLCYTTP